MPLRRHVAPPLRGDAVLPLRVGAVLPLHVGAVLPPRAGAVLRPRVGAVLPPRVGAVLRPRVGAVLPLHVGAVLPPRAGVALPPRVGAVVRPPAVGGPLPRRDVEPQPGAPLPALRAVEPVALPLRRAAAHPPRQLASLPGVDALPSHVPLAALPRQPHARLPHAPVLLQPAGPPRPGGLPLPPDVPQRVPGPPRHVVPDPSSSRY